MFQIFDEFGIEQNLEDRTCCSSSKVLRERTLTSGLMKKEHSLNLLSSILDNHILYFHSDDKNLVPNTNHCFCLHLE